MADHNKPLPEGTDTIIAGASTETGSTAAGAANESVGETEPLLSGSAVSGSTAKIIDKVRGSGEKLSGQAAEKARGLVSQGLERSAEALANVSKLIGDTADGLDERLGEDYGTYARRAAGAIEGAADKLAAKDPDELIDDTREFVRNSPGVALAGAAIVGFAIARLVKTGLADRDSKRGGRGTKA